MYVSLDYKNTKDKVRNMKNGSALESLAKDISSLKEKLNAAIIEKPDNIELTLELSKKLDALIARYYQTIKQT